MAKSKTQKIRAHAVRNGKRDPELNRLSSPDYSMHERKLPTFQEKRTKSESKYRFDLSHC